MIKNNKAQVTVFMIVGIVVVIGIALFIYINAQATKTEIAHGVKVSVEKLPTELQPVAGFVESCIKSIGTSAVRQIGQTGGFDELANSNPVVPTESSSVELLPGTGLNVAYWYHLKDNNRCTTCLLGFDNPRLHKKDGEPSIETALGRYVNNNLNECLNDFRVFSGQGISVAPLGAIAADVSVTDDNVVFVVDYPLKLKTGNVEETATKFYAAIPLKLKKMYRLADYITGLEATNNFIEKDVLNLIVGFSGLDADNKLPPMSDFRFGDPVNWRKSQVKENIVNILTSYIPALQVYDTRNYEQVDSGNELGDSLYNYGMLVPSDGSFSDLEVSFAYLGWEPYFNLNCRGELCEPEHMTFKLLQVFNMQNYNFVYDLSFPVLVTITDPDALLDEGYVFQFMLEGNIRHNNPLTTDTALIEAVVMEESMFCDTDKMNSGTITINVKSPDDVLLDDVQVGYSCAGQDCFIGETSRGVLEANFPICLGGIISLSKEDYLGQYQYLDTQVGKEASLDFVLQPIKEKKFVIRKKLLIKKNGKWEPALGEKELTENEEAIVTLTRKSSVYDDDYSITSVLEGQQGEISLYSGEYDIDINVISRDRFVIPEREEETPGIIFGIGSQKYTVPGIEFNETDPFISGGLALSYSFTKHDLSNDVIVFNIVGIDFLGVDEDNRRIEDLQEMGKIEDYSTAYEGVLIPGFRK